MKEKEWSFEKDMKELARVKKRQNMVFRRFRAKREEVKKEVEKAKEKYINKVYVIVDLIGKNVKFTYMGFDKLDRNCRRVARGVLTIVDRGSVYLGDYENDDAYDIDEIIKIEVIEQKSKSPSKGK